MAYPFTRNKREQEMDKSAHEYIMACREFNEDMKSKGLSWSEILEIRRKLSVKDIKNRKWRE